LIIGYVELLFTPGSTIFLGQALLSWPKAEIMQPYLYAGSSAVIPMGYGTIWITFLLDRGPKQVPIPIFDIGLFASLVTVHMPYYRETT